MKIYIIISWMDANTTTHPKIISTTNRKQAIEIARQYRDSFYKGYPNSKTLIRVDEHYNKNDKKSGITLCKFIEF